MTNNVTKSKRQSPSPNKPSLRNATINRQQTVATTPGVSVKFAGANNVAVKKTKSLLKSTKSNFVNQQSPSLATSRTASSSPPFGQLKSKSRFGRSKSKRYDPHDIPPMSAMDYVWLVVYFICLYTFYAAFWYGMWMIYVHVTPATKKPPRSILHQIYEQKPHSRTKSLSVPCIPMDELSSFSNRSTGLH